jgi:hypothetical protein
LGDSDFPKQHGLIGIVAVQPNATSSSLSLFSLNRIGILLILPENESSQRQVAYSLAGSVVFAQKRNYEQSSLYNL